MSKEIEFISQIGPIVQKYAQEFGYHVASPIIAQACLESGFGTSNKASHHNYFGMKYRLKRCPSASGIFVDKSKEQKKDGKIYGISDQWFEFRTMEDGVRGYFEFISISNYDALRRNNITDPKTYLKTLIDCKYATSLTYVESNMKVIEAYNLEQYDKIFQEEKDDAQLHDGDRINLLTMYYFNGRQIPAWIFKVPLYYRGESPNGIKFSTKPTGEITGIINEGMYEKYIDEGE